MRLSIFFWIAAMFAFWLAIEKSPRFSFWWPLTGLLIGLGFLQSLHQRVRDCLRGARARLCAAVATGVQAAGLVLATRVFILCTIPPIVWNAQQPGSHCVTLRTRGSLADNMAFVRSTAEIFWRTFHFYSPLLFGALVWAVTASWPPRKPAVQNFVFCSGLVCQSLPSIFCFHSTTLRRRT